MDLWVTNMHPKRAYLYACLREEFGLNQLIDSSAKHESIHNLPIEDVEKILNNFRGGVPIDRITATNFNSLFTWENSTQGHNYWNERSRNYFTKWVDPPWGASLSETGENDDGPLPTEQELLECGIILEQ